MSRNHALRFSALFVLFAGSTAVAQQPSTALPPAATLVAKYSDAVGGAAMLKAPQITSKGSLMMAAAGINATFEMVQIQPSKMRMVTTIPGVGEILVGYDGTNAWSVDPMQGPRVLAGKEKTEIQEEADPRASVRSMELIEKAETVADTTMGTERCYLVKLNWKSGRETFDCYSPATGLLVGSKSVQSTAMGEIPVATIYSDYKKFGDFMMPTKMVQSLMGQEQS